MNKTVHIVLTSVGVSIVAFLLVAACAWGYIMTPTDEMCQSIEYIFEDGDERMYLSNDEMNTILKNEHIYPVGKTLDVITLHRIEQAVCHHSMVRNAECYLTPRYEVKVLIEQRIPLLRVRTPGDTYFIDTDRRKMPVRNSVKDKVLVVTGVVGENLASNALADFALWLQEEPYWNEKINYVHMASPQMMCLYLHGEQQPCIMMGKVQDYEQKLQKLRTFFENGQEAVGEKKYKEIDVRFHGQVIGRY